MTVEAQLHNLTLDLLYRFFCQKKTNAQIRDELQHRRLPQLSDEALAHFRGEFRAKEIRFPDQMRVFRRRLKVK